MQKSSGCRADPSIFLRTMIARGEPSPSVIHRDLITARTETRAHLDVAFSPRDYRNDAITLHVPTLTIARRLQKVTPLPW